jgi:hypothetical protein
VAVKASKGSSGVEAESPPQAVKPAPTPPNMAAADTAPVLLKKFRRDALGVIRVSLDVETPGWTFSSC